MGAKYHTPLIKRAETVVISIMAVLLPLSVSAQPDSTTARKGFLHSYWQSLINGNVDRTREKKFDVTFGIAPTYTQEGSFGLGGTMTGLYRMDRRDTLTMPSNIIFSASASLRGFYVADAIGSNYFPDRKGRLVYNVRFSRKDLDFWGIRFRQCVSNPTGEYVRTQVKVDADYIYELGQNISSGTGIRINYALAGDLSNKHYLDGQRPENFLAGINASLLYDTRDSHTNPSKGIFLMLRGTLWPEFLSDSGSTYLAGGMTLSGYHPLWKGAVLAGDLYLYINDRNCPWNLREEICGHPGRMRGYYVGRYIDSCQMCAQIELRQRLWQRLGAVVWGGAGTLFPSFRDFSWQNILPNYGLGLRFEYKKDINLRADLGFGRNAWGFTFGFSEAF